MTDRELLQMALDALQYIYTETTTDEDDLIHAAINALRARLAQGEPEQLVRDLITHGMAISKGGERIDPTSIYKQPEPEPFCYMSKTYEVALFAEPPEPNSEWADMFPVYTAPPQREWQGLTDDEITETLKRFGLGERTALTRAIESRLKGKNA